MGINILLTLTGTDRVGIVDEVTRSLLELGGNIETSRMARLGGEFAALMLVYLPADTADMMQTTVDNLVARGYKVTTTPTDPTRAKAHAGWLPYHINVQGADHEGIVHSLAHTLAVQGISIEAMETGNTRAPNSGALLFTMSAQILVPPELDQQLWQTQLEKAGNEQHVDVSIAAAS